MKINSLPKVLVALFATCIISYVLSSCRDNAIPLQEKSKVSESYNSTFLEFKDVKAFMAKLTEVSKMKKEQLGEWEQSRGFVSMRSIYENILDLELKTIEEEEQKINDNPSLKSQMKHKFSDLYGNNKEVIQLTDYGFEINSPDLAYASLINKNGIVKIEGDIYQFSRNKVKIIKSGDVNKISSLKNFNDNGKFDNIEVQSILTNQPIFQKNARPNWEGRCDSDNGSYWLTAWFTTSQVPMYFNGTPVTSLRTTITSRHLRRSWFGWIDHNTTSYSASGSFALTIQLPTANFYGGSLPNNQGYPFSTGQGWAGNTAYAQYGLTDNLALGHPNYTVYLINNASTTFNFLDRSCTVNY